MAALFPNLATAHYLKGERLWFQAPAVVQDGELVAADPAHLERALEQFNKAIVADPSFAPPYLGRGNIRLDLGDYQGALEDGERLIELKPEHPAGYALRAGALLAMGRTDAAADDFARVAQPLPDSTQAWDAHFVRCVAFRAADRLSEAISDCERSLELNDLHASTFDVLGELYYRNGRYEDALDAYADFADLAPGDIRTATNRGVVFMALGRYEDALPLLDQAIATTPDYGAAYQLRAETRLRLDDVEGARDDAEQAVELLPDDVQSLIIQAFVALYSEDFATAFAIADTLERRGEDEALVRLLRGYTYAFDGNAPAALEELDRAIDLAPTLAEAYDSRSYAKYVAGDYAGALADASRALELVEPYARSIRGEILYHRALARFALEDAQGAESDAREALALRPVPLIERDIQQLLGELTQR
jgi:tetratricopeptide (TPR) repeat protein